MIHKYYSNGKLLLSGEYAVLDGALSWAIPTRFGQYLEVADDDNNQIYWKSFDERGKVWFECTYLLESFEILKTTDQETSKTLQNILQQIKKLNPNFLSNSKGVKVNTTLTFPRNWGLGTSSTLINNIALWAAVNPYKLLELTFKGSGYDIACASHNTPILYQLQDNSPQVTTLPYQFSFAEHLFFIYLNKKKNSRDAISSYRKANFDKNQLVLKITELTRNFVNSATLSEFEKTIQEHESVISNALQIPTVKADLFSDFKGEIKSLGGWGGDFILATGNSDTSEYFKNRGYETVIPFKSMIL